MSKFFISRPIFAAVISIVIVIAGLVASRVLPIPSTPRLRRLPLPSRPTTLAPVQKPSPKQWPRLSRNN